MSLPVAPTSVTLYDVVKDIGFPAVVALILLFQIGPKLDMTIETNQQISDQMAQLTSVCTAARATGS